MIHFTTCFNLEQFTDSELNEIKDRCSSIEAYVIQEKVEEREKIFEISSNYDFHSQNGVIAHCSKLSTARRYYGLQDAFRSLLYGQCCLYYNQGLYIDNPEGTWKILQISGYENTLTDDDNLKYHNESYLFYLIQKGFTYGIEENWYDKKRKYLQVRNKRKKKARSKDRSKHTMQTAEEVDTEQDDGRVG